ncbi:endonuclease III [Blattabacterium sp. (Blaberus giganteus)]|uniref:endonuclease III domain-containing protein n=1 Tax=Blattabacterium sp. (Blaberus giganteus) TaxID=1186051 RepID=UPI00025F6E2B|nr:endonuclease III [Blattabacterium sp. (Blaberus giganteus)]AFJ90509.1 endonuclease III [Blattabacterium sp. (Blaberus giganteus)]
MNLISKKIKIIEKILDFLYPNPTSTLYYVNEYTLLISIILTAKSKEERVNKITKSLFNKINTPMDTIRFSIEEIKNIIKNIGLYNIKSKNIYNLSVILINKYNGIIPKNILKLKSLPGVGHKTASVFLSHVSNEFVFPVDTHIHRMMFRWKLSNGKNVVQTEKDAKRVFKKKNWKKLHFQIISYAKEYSPSYRWDSKKDVIYQELLNNNLLFLN